MTCLKYDSDKSRKYVGFLFYPQKTLFTFL